MRRRYLPAVVTAIVVVAVVAIAVARVAGVKSPGYQATAHLAVGALFAGWAGGGGRLLLGLALGLTAVEGLCFFLVK